MSDYKLFGNNKYMGWLRKREPIDLYFTQHVGTSRLNMVTHFMVVSMPRYQWWIRSASRSVDWRSSSMLKADICTIKKWVKMWSADVFLSWEYFWAHVGGRTDLKGLRESSVAKRFGCSKVTKLHNSGLGDKDICRLQISVNNISMRINVASVRIGAERLINF